MFLSLGEKESSRVPISLKYITWSWFNLLSLEESYNLYSREKVSSEVIEHFEGKPPFSSEQGGRVIFLLVTEDDLGKKQQATPHLDR